jgi:quercetin dioxygenase-like cupin family protein
MAKGPQHEEQILNFEGFPGRWEIRKSTADTDGERFETRMEIEAPGELPPHKHPLAEESYEVLAGEIEIQVEGEWTTLQAGEKHVVPPDTAHSFRNTDSVEMINIHKPALRYEEYFRRFHKLKTERGVEMPPSGLKGMVLLGMLQSEYEREFVGVNPPQWAFNLLGALGRLLGFQLPA